MSLRIAIWTLAVLGIGIGSALGADLDEESRVEALVARAGAEGLGLSEAWLRLGHWRRTPFGGWKSEADGPAFFLADNGKWDPEAELEATIRAFHATEWEQVPDWLPAARRGADTGSQEDVPQGGNSDRAGAAGLRPDSIAPWESLPHPLCRFPARLRFLEATLGLDRSKLPRVDCPGLAEFRSAMSVVGVDLVFSSYYLNSPASAFGHTFLRVERAGTWIRGERKDLLDFGIDFSAEVDTENPIAYVVKGLTGMFPGRFHRIPYYYKVREYSDYEARDIWEYHLALDQPTLDTLIDHIWELGWTHFDYYYLDENCSYHVLGALDAVVPQFDLLARLKPVVVPVDTIKALFSTPGLVSDVRFRPSLRSQFLARVQGFDRTMARAVRDLVGDPDSPIPDTLTLEQQVRVLDAALDLTDLRFADEIVFEPESHGAALKQSLLVRRASLGVPSEPLDVQPTTASAHLGHGSSRMGVGVGVQSSGNLVLQYDFRVALHDLADPPTGYPETFQIEFLPLTLQLEPATGKVRLERFSLVDVVSINPITWFDHDSTWRFQLGARTLRQNGCPDCTVATVSAGGGGAVSLANGALTCFLTADALIMAGPDLVGFYGAPVWTGLGPGAGIRIRPWSRLVMVASGRWVWLPWQGPGAIWDLGARMRLQVLPRVAVDLEVRAEPVSSEVLLSTFFYY